MMKNILRSIAAVLALIVVTLSVLYLNRSDPYAIIPGKQMNGEEVAGKIDDWSFTLEHRGVTNEVRPSDPYSVNTSSLLVDEVLYIPSGKGRSRWAEFLLEDPNMRIRVGTKIYPVRATLVEEPAELKKVREVYGAKYPGRPPESIEEFWFFQIDSR